mmetsp:Transcript_7075/g.15101  ORF Transcript_7075/g.15101 Transcript_7075/m.15101 type:complete len:116 (-) Transcript_7075:1804-2151(-)
MLRRVGNERLVPDGPVFWGMIRKLIHLVEIKRVPVEELKEYNYKQRVILRNRLQKALDEKRKAKAEERAERMRAQSLRDYKNYMKSLSLNDETAQSPVRHIVRNTDTNSSEEREQ